MANQSTIDKLIEMRLTAMAIAFRNQQNDSKFKKVPFKDRFGMLVDIEFTSRKNNRLKKLIHNAGLDQPEASIMNINYASGHKLNKELISRLAICEYIYEHQNLFITGATGCSKTYMACAFSMTACKQYFNAKYVHLPDLLNDLEIARLESNYKKVMAKYSNPVDLILKEWYDQLYGNPSPLANAIIDCIAHYIYRINITSIDAAHDISMQEVYGLDKNLRE